ncbi:MAG: ImmA/IrrE family metallo-endopeptidase [Planctomycetota bacterium]
MIPDLPAEAVDAATQRVADELIWEAGIDGPPVDAFRVADSLGLVVATAAATAARGSLARFATTVAEPKPRRGVILLAPDQRPERRQWAVAHEIGEWAAVRVCGRLGVPAEQAAGGVRERIANALASRLLLPARWFGVDGDCADWDLLSLKALYNTASHELIARRLLEVVDTPAAITVMDQGATGWRRSNFRREPPPWGDAERAAWRHCHERGEPTIAGPEGEFLVRVRAWPVHEPGWRREVLLSEYTDHG